MSYNNMKDNSPYNFVRVFCYIQVSYNGSMTVSKTVHLGSSPKACAKCPSDGNLESEACRFDSYLGHIKYLGVMQRLYLLPLEGSVRGLDSHHLDEERLFILHRVLIKKDSVERCYGLLGDGLSFCTVYTEERV